MAKATREAYGEELAKLVVENPKIVVLDADLAGATKTAMAKKACPERFFDMGIAEADMIGHAAGLAASGYIPFASTFAMFAAGRAWEQIRNSVAYPHLNVKVCATHAGITVGEDPCDEAETKAVIDHVAETKTPCYVRLGRAAVENVYPAETKFDFSKVNVVRKGEKVAVFACGVMVQSALGAAEMLKADGVNLTVVDVCAIKPADEAGIVEILKSHDRIFTAEEHNIIGGLGGMIAEVAGEKCPKPIHRIGVKDRYAESGPAAGLMKKYGLDAEGVYKEIKENL